MTNSPAPDRAPVSADAGWDEPATEASGLVPTARKEAHDPVRLLRNRRRRIALVSAILIVGICMMAGFMTISGDSAQVARVLRYTTVKPRDLPITVMERGTIESQHNVEIKCELEDVSGDGISGNVILWIIENGSVVEKGDLIVEMDPASQLERLDQQKLKTIYARGQFTARTLDYENRKTLNETIQANAELAVEMARLKLQQYEDEKGGTFQIELQDVELGIQQSKAWRLIKDGDLKAVEHLHELGYKSGGDLAQAQLQALSAGNAVKRGMAQRRELVDFTHVRSKRELESDLKMAERALIQVEENNKAALRQNGIWKKMAEMGKVWNEQYLAHYQEQLGKCKIYAPQSGMVAYHVDADRWGNSSAIRAGTAVRSGQVLLSIPDMKHMRVATSVHESVVNRVKAGMRATVHIDAFPDRHYVGTVESVDVLPDPGGWLASDTKFYKTIVTIDGEVDQIKPGMTAVVTIHIDRLHNILCVPVQAIVQRGDQTWCYISDNGQLVKRPIDPGRCNDRFVEVRAGLVAGESVVLDASAVLANQPDAPREVAPDKMTEEEFALY